MAYKFNLGTFNLGGTLDVEASTGADINLPNNSVDNADLAGSIALTKLEAVNAGRVVMGNGSNAATATAISGDISLANNGAVSLAAAQTNITSILNASFEAIGTAGDQEAIDFTQANEVSINVNGNSILTTTTTGVDVAGNVSGSGNLQGGGLQVAGTTASTFGISVLGAANQSAAQNVLGLRPGTEVQAFDAQLTELATMNANTADALADLLNTEVQALDGAAAANNTTGKVAILGTDGNLTIAGNLTVQGTTTTVDSTTINISQSFTFEGPADDHETTLHVGTPTQDIQVELPQHSSSAGAHTVRMAVLANGDTATNYGLAAAVTAGEFALLDGGATVGTTALADADGFLHNDSGTMRQTRVVKIAELAFSKVTGDATITSAGNLTIEAGAVDNDMLAGSIADSKLNQITTAGKVAIGALEIDGASDIGEALVDADLIIVDNGANGTEVKCAMSRVKTYIENNASISADSANKLTRTVNINGPVLATAKKTISGDSEIDVFNITASATAEISGSWDAGDMVTIKAGSSVSTSVVLTVSSAAGYQYTYDGQASLRLESAHAAVDLIYVSGASGNDWIIL